MVEADFKKEMELIERKGSFFGGRGRMKASPDLMELYILLKETEN